MNEIIVIAEFVKQDITDSTKEMLSIGKKYARLNGLALAVVVLGEKYFNLAEVLIAFGADCVYAAKHKELNSFNSEIYLNTLEDFMKKHRPELVLCAMTANGRDIGTRLAARLRTVYLSGCTSISSNSDGVIKVTRPKFQGLGQELVTVKKTKTVILGIPPQSGVLEKPIACNELVQLKLNIGASDTIMSSGHYCRAALSQLEYFAAKGYSTPTEVHEGPTPAYRSGGLKGLDTPRIEIIDPVIPPYWQVRHINYYISASEEIDLAEAEVVIAGGNGLGNKETFALLRELGNIIGAPVGGSRVASDKGWIQQARMIGATGKVIRPRVYLALGISGAIQHLMGIKGGKIIIVNKDPHSEFMQTADLAVIGDLREILPALVEQLRVNRSKAELRLVNNETEN